MTIVPVVHGILNFILRVAFVVGPVLVLAASAGAQPKRIVEIGDENRDGRYTGVDVEQALKRCRPGCILRAGIHIYEDVAVVIDKHFPEGLVIQGSGIGETVFRSPIPVQAPIFWIRGGQPGVEFRDFSLDGRKSEQTNASSIPDSVGIRVSDLSRIESDSGRIESISVAHFITAGVLIRDGRDWHVSRNSIGDIGCHTDLPCPRMPGKDADPYIKGRRSVGYGIMINGVGASGAVVERNRVAGVTKIGIEAFTNKSQLGSANRVRNVRIIHNRVSGALSSGITTNGGVGIEIIGNEVWDSGGSGIAGNAGAGISCAGASDRLVVVGNDVHDTDGSGMRLGCQGNGLIVRDNWVEGACRLALIAQGAVSVIGRQNGGSVGLVVKENHVDARSGQCAYAFFVSRWHDVEVTGGVYLGGKRAVLFFADARRIRLAGLRASVLDGVPPLWLRDDVKDVSVAADVLMDRQTIKAGEGSSLLLESP